LARVLLILWIALAHQDPKVGATLDLAYLFVYK